MADEDIEVPVDQIDSGGLFTDATTDGGAMLSQTPEFDGAEPSQIAEPVEAKGGKKLLRIDLGNNNFVVGETERELLEKLAKGKMEADRAVKEREAENKALRSQLTVTQTNVAPPQPAAKTYTEEFSGQKFLNDLGEKPLEAIRYAMNYLDGGGLNPVVNEKVDYAYNVAQKVDQQLMAAEFHRRNPDWQPTDENATKLLDVLNQNGLAPSLPHLEWAKTELIRRGEITPMDTNDGIVYEDITFGQPQQQPPRRTSRGNGAPPAPRGTGSQTVVEAVNPDTMPMKDLTELLRKKGALPYG